ncbi:type VI secretion system ImpA family N-terminal domain-containing protein [Erwinia tracheiphila]|uniref:ImpA domain-containing protein n=1 Tax=Erwinia tracheiphila TaxID=65700 RepID=A0A0M2K8G8_9GAMM|nr:type VI secretion system ImpA family N-terminal domain-containing protein [Erwinia tracheiphila]EOS92951.1 ImpA domain-containing protein [Erwinia tracheiphila PSU-1]KKF35685.1 hypothetical protein SY86_10040 [Erwinia tracheiphila]UIA89856.1 type VI secretion system ImpA family N-terminal domain-containing protein [Erwinia tracheiphila]UIA98159.1 type VI secretion system ImpA family N-terminal domain-containing protein [Erwinia tracheiphila]
MTTSRQNILHTGSDPRVLPEFIQLRHETGKKSRSDDKNVDWQRVEELSIALFRRNGMDLQSVAWYSMARAWRAGLAGLCEGLEIITAMLKYQWPTLWPHPLPARLAIITWLSNSIQQFMRTLTLNQTDLPLVLRLRSALDESVELLEKLAQRHLSQLDWLNIQVSDLIRGLLPTRPSLEQLNQHVSQEHARGADDQLQPPDDNFTPLVYVPHDLSEPNTLKVSFSFWERSRGFITGMIAMLLCGTMAIWAWHLMQPLPNRAQRMTLLAQQIVPQQVRQEIHWRKYAEDAALPDKQMLLWQTVQYRLQKLSQDLDTLEKANPQSKMWPELKARVVTIQQPFEELTPLEDLLLKLQKNNASPVLRGKIEQRMKQLLARYALILGEDPHYEKLY